MKIWPLWKWLLPLQVVAKKYLLFVESYLDRGYLMHSIFNAVSINTVNHKMLSLWFSLFQFENSDVAYLLLNLRKKEVYDCFRNQTIWEQIDNISGPRILKTRNMKFQFQFPFEWIKSFFLSDTKTTWALQKNTGQYFLENRRTSKINLSSC